MPARVYKLGFFSMHCTECTHCLLVRESDTQDGIRPVRYNLIGWNPVLAELDWNPVFTDSSVSLCGLVVQVGKQPCTVVVLSKLKK